MRTAPLSPPNVGNEAWRQIRNSLSQISARVQPFYPFSVTGDITISGDDYGFFLVDASGGAVAVTLPSAAANAGRCFSVKKIDATANTVTVAGAETIDGGPDAVISTPYTCLTFMSDGVEWWIV